MTRPRRKLTEVQIHNGTVVDIMCSVDEENLHLYFKYFNHEANEGKQPTDFKEDEDK
jgi:hypothetical protein